MARLMGRFTASALVVFLVLGVGTALASRQAGTSQAIDNASQQTVYIAKAVVEPVLDEGILTMDSASLDRLDAIVRKRVLSPDLVRIKIWTAAGLIAYSDEPLLLGATFPLGDEELRALRNGTHDAEVSSVDKPENFYERRYGRQLLEVYLPVRTPGGTPLLFEAYFPIRAVSKSGWQIFRTFGPIALGALLLLQLLQLPLAWRLAQRLQSGQLERERLLRQAIEASDRERRRIAADLHDGVVQDLSGLSYALSAAGAGAPDADGGTMGPREAAQVIRSSILALRSLLVDIYPPNLEEEGLQDALGDLAARFANRGVDVRIRYALPERLTSQTARLLYRGAQECLRNVTAHARATSVDISAEEVAGAAHLVVSDDGRGFDPEVISNREAASDRFGLRALADLLEDAGGSLDVDSSPGHGTRVSLQVPLR